MSAPPPEEPTPTSPPAAPAPAESAPPRRPLWRNPWVFAALGGMVAMTAIRPCLRRIPPPPPALAKLPAFGLTDLAGQPAGSVELAGHTYILGLVRLGCAVHCVPAARAMRTLARRYDRMKIPVQLVLLAVDPPAEVSRAAKGYLAARQLDSSRVRLVAGSPAALQPLLSALARGAGWPPPPRASADAFEELAHRSRLFLIDAAGNLRGAYRTDELGTDEAYHRGLHVWLPKP